MLVWSIVLAAMLVTALLYGVSTPAFDTPTVWRTVLFAALGCLGIALVLLTPRFKQGRVLVLGIWLPAILLRLVFLPAAPSDDVNRYLWEGKLVLNGVSPYDEVADSESLVEYRDDYWEAMNHKDKATAYPPLTELLFAAVASIAYHPLAFKCAFIIADCLVIAALLSILRSRGISEACAGFYAFNPVALVSFAGEAHFDVWMLAALVWGVWAFDKKRYDLAVSLASIATGIKWVTLPLIPFFCHYSKPSDYARVAVVAFAVLLLPSLYFWNSISSLVEGLFAFGGTRSFNGPIYDLLLLGLGFPRGWCSILVGAVFSLVILWRWLLRSKSPLDAHIRWILGALIILSPTVHFWYIAWILPFVCLRPSFPWLVLSVTSAVYFYVWINPVWGLLLEQRWAFWAPFFLALVYELWSTRARVAFPFGRSTESSNSIAVVIPTLNVADQLPGALASLAAQALLADEVICVDAGSIDETRAIAEASDLAVNVIESEKGRGQQIAAGIEAAQSDWVCVLHADARLSVDSLEHLKRAVSSDLTISGGAFGQRFEDDQVELLPIELLNDLRALFTRTAFGDQVQFFHRETALKFSLMPKQPLMEDVESSWRIRETGGFVFLGQPCLVSHRSWEASEWIQRFALVMRLVSRYRFARLRSRQSAEALSRELYEEYYKNGK